MNWRETILGNEIDFFNGKSIKPGQIGQYPAYGSNGIIGGSDEWKYENAIIIGRVGAYCGSVAYCPKRFWASDNTIVSKPKNHSSSIIFYYYLLHHLELNKYAGGAAQPLVTQTVLKKVSVRIPDFTIQRRIASILSAYDDLIENNTRRIAILEEMARRIYEEWFVNFKFPGHEKIKMVDSELGKIPEGWRVEKLGDILTTLEAGSRPKGGIDPDERGVPSIGAENINGLGRYDFSKEKYISREFFQSMRRGHLMSGDVLLYKDGAYIGKKALFRDGFPHPECSVNEHVFILRADKRVSQSYLYFWLDQPEMTSNIRALNANAAQPGINQLGVKSLSIIVPTSNIIKQFDMVTEPILALIFNLAKKIPILRTTRDFLLPKLISGEIDVSNLPEPEEAAA